MFFLKSDFACKSWLQAESFLLSPTFVIGIFCGLKQRSQAKAGAAAFTDKVLLLLKQQRSQAKAGAAAFTNKVLLLFK